MQPQQEQDAAAEIELIKGIVSKYFPVYETKLSHDSVSFHCRVEPVLLEEHFSRLREELGSHGYTPIITYKGGEHIVIVGKLPEIKRRGIRVNIVMLSLTILTTIVAGTILWKDFIGETTGPFFTINSVLMGALTFSLPLMAVLGIHEMGHYLMAKHHGVPASLPFFIPAPPPLPLGTFGAFISIRGPMPNRKTLFDLGVAGPIAGFLATIPVAIIGMILTGGDARPIPDETGNILVMMAPLIYNLLQMLVPISGEYLLHPTAFAAWVGFLVTAINLLPAGSLDGGHIASAMFGQNAKYISWAAVIGLFILGMFYLGWMLFAVIILFLGMQHAPPLNDITILSPKRKLIGIGMVAMLIVSFVPIPFSYAVPDYSFDAQLQGTDYGNVSASFNHTFVILVNSTGNMNTTLVFELSPSDYDELSFDLKYRSNGENVSASTPNELELPVTSNLTICFSVYLTSPVLEDRDVNLTIVIVAEEDTSFRREIPIYVKEISGNYEFWVEPSSDAIAPGEIKKFSIIVNSSSLSNISLDMIAIMPMNWSAGLYLDDDTNATNQLDILLEPLENISYTLVIQAPLSASSGDSVIIEIRSTSEDLQETRIKELSLLIE